MSQQNKRLDWEDNHRRISNAILSHYKTSQKSPTQEEIAKLAGISRETVNKHLQEMDYDKLFERDRARLAAHSDVITMAVVNSALKGSFGAQKLLFQVVYGWAEPKTFTHIIEEEYKPMSDEDKKQLAEASEMMKKLDSIRGGYKKARKPEEPNEQPAS